METTNIFDTLGEMDIGEVDVNGIVNNKQTKRAKRPRTIEPVNTVLLDAYFPPKSQIRTAGEKYRWIAKVLKLEPYKHIENALELKVGRNNIYVRCKTEEILTLITSVGAAGEILQKPRVFGKGECKNLIIFDIPMEIEDEEIMNYNERILHARRVKINGKMTQRVVITYQGAIIPKKIKVLEGMAPFRCAIFHSLTPFCSHCSKWGHGIRACLRETARCRYCAGAHTSSVCASKISEGEKIPSKCVNCRLGHNANSKKCVYFPKDRIKHQEKRTPTMNPVLAPLNDDQEYPELRNHNTARVPSTKRRDGHHAGNTPRRKKKQTSNVGVPPQDVSVDTRTSQDPPGAPTTMRDPPPPVRSPSPRPTEASTRTTTQASQPQVNTTSSIENGGLMQVLLQTVNQLAVMITQIQQQVDKQQKVQERLLNAILEQQTTQQASAVQE